MTQPFLLHDDSAWIPVRDANPSGLEIFKRHYSYGRNRSRNSTGHFVGPGERLVLLTPDARALFVWRLEKFRRDDQSGINCSIFRNEGAGLSSHLIREACRMAWDRWPNARLFTTVNPRKIRSVNPGCCFIKAGWKKCGITKFKKLLILECLPSAEAAR